MKHNASIIQLGGGDTTNVLHKFVFLYLLNFWKPICNSKKNLKFKGYTQTEVFAKIFKRSVYSGSN